MGQAPVSQASAFVRKTLGVVVDAGKLRGLHIRANSPQCFGHSAEGEDTLVR